MSEIILGLLVIALGGFIYYKLAKKLNIFEKMQDNDDDFNCH